MKNIAVFCGSSDAHDPRFKLAARAVGKFNAENGITTVYGGANVGLMGVLADSVVEHGGRIVGVMPKFLEWKEIIHPHLTEFIEVEDMQERKRVMFDRSDSCICLPGAFGTLDELSEWCTWTQLKLQSNQTYKPCGILNIGGYFDHLIKFLDRNVLDGLMLRSDRSMIHVSQNIGQLVVDLEHAYQVQTSAVTV